jgi:anti-sigma regulatory factor (Ser/Thr protein kinase)
MGNRSGRRRARAGFPAELVSAARARSFVGNLCRSWGIPEAVLEAEMVVTELVENAIRHSHSDCDVSVALADSTLTIGVADHGHRPPQVLYPRPDTPGGRGLLMVQNIAHRWGYRPTGDGKVVWADLSVV